MPSATSPSRLSTWAVRLLVTNTHDHHRDDRVDRRHQPGADQSHAQRGDIDPLEPTVHASSNRYPAPRTVTIWMPVFGSLARSRLIWTSMALDPSGWVSSRQACSAIGLAVDDRRRPPKQQFQDVELRGRQVHRRSVDLDLAPRGVERERASGDRGAVDVARAPLQRADPGDELAEVERFDQVVVSAGIEALDPVRRGVPRREHEHRRRAVVAACPGRRPRAR